MGKRCSENVPATRQNIYPIFYVIHPDGNPEERDPHASSGTEDLWSSPTSSQTRRGDPANRNGELCHLGALGRGQTELERQLAIIRSRTSMARNSSNLLLMLFPSNLRS